MSFTATLGLPARKWDQKLTVYPGWGFSEIRPDSLNGGYLWKYSISSLPLLTANKSPYSAVLTTHNIENADGSIGLTTYPFTLDVTKAGGATAPAYLPAGMGMDFALVDLAWKTRIDGAVDRLFVSPTDKAFKYDGDWAIVGGSSDAMYPIYATKQVGDSFTWKFFDRSMAVMGTYGSDFFNPPTGRANLSITLDNQPPHLFRSDRLAALPS